LFSAWHKTEVVIRTNVN